MKKIITLCLLFSINLGNAQSNSEILSKLSSIERRLSKLESSVFKTDSESGLKVKNLGGNTMDSEQSTGSGKQESLTQEQHEDLQNQIKAIQKNKADSQKLLDELMNED